MGGEGATTPTPRFRVVFIHRPPLVSMGRYGTLRAAEEDAARYPGETVVEENVGGSWVVAGGSVGTEPETKEDV